MSPEPLDLDAIEARANAATPGPWEPVAEEVVDPDDPAFAHFMHHVQVTNDADHDDAGEMIWYFADRSERRTDFQPNVVFVAHAREDVPALCAELRAARVLVDRLQTQRDGLKRDIARGRANGDLGFMDDHQVCDEQLHAANRAHDFTAIERDQAIKDRDIAWRNLTAERLENAALVSSIDRIRAELEQALDDPDLDLDAQALAGNVLAILDRVAAGSSGEPQEPNDASV